MTPTVANGFVILVFVSNCQAGLNTLNALSTLTSRPLQNIAAGTKEFIQIAAENGYHAEKHEVITDDGYILTMFRIPPGEQCAKKAPVLCMHGLLQSAEGFIDIGTEAPGFILSKDCYDVWFGNVRGNFHSRKHVHLDPDKHLQFWKFSVDEMGLYDIPAMVDYVLAATNVEKLIYIGFSQGGGTFFIMNSERPEYADKVSLFIGLAPATRQYYSKSEVFRITTVGASSLQAPLEATGVWEILSKGLPIQGALSILCQVELLATTVCSLVVALVDSAHPDSVTPEIVKIISEQAPAGTSVQNYARYGQAMKSLKFVKFDYGTEKNMKVYGACEPPEYDLKAVKMPAVIFHGQLDHLVDTKDIGWAVSQLPNVLEYITLADPLWNHLDMTYSRYWKQAIYVKMKNYLDKYDSIC